METKIVLSSLVSILLAANALAYNCTDLAVWDASKAYTGKMEVQHNTYAYRANYWTLNNNPETSHGDYQEWKLLGLCDDMMPINQPPILSIISPQVGDYSVGSLLELSANATDSDGSIAEVLFSVDGVPVSSDTQSPFSASWEVTVGSHTITATAFDDDGASTSRDVSITGLDPAENQAPQVTINAPTSTSFKLGDMVVVKASATDSDGSISRVEFFVDGALVETDFGQPYDFSWKAQLGNHQISVVAVDNENATSSERFLSVSVVDDTVEIPTGDCRPEGLYTTPGIEVPYCTVYDENGIEKLGPNHNRRIIGYFTAWRNGTNGQAQYLASDIPWEKLTHINYACAHIDDANRVSVGNVNSATNPATGMTWPDVSAAQMDSSFAYQGHFNLLNKFKKQYPHVKTLVSIGGWAETGGYFDETGERVANGGFYSMTTRADGSVNTVGIDTFATSAVDFIRTYGFDGVDIDYEYPTSMAGAGNPADYWLSDGMRDKLWASYQVLMKTLREKLDAAGAEDGRHYQLTIASPSSAYLLRGMEDFDVTPYLDFVNIMSYDLHGAWNEYVGHNSALFDTGDDLELEVGNVYSTSQYGQIGYLNTDWAVHYFRGAMPAGRLNIGVPYYTRGWQGVTGGTHGLWGRAALPQQNLCPTGTGMTAKCGYGAMGINNIWHDKDTSGNEIGAGSNPMWHAKNLQEGIAGSYLSEYGFPTNTQLSDQYNRYYDDTAESPWLWNAKDNVFISIEDEQSMAAKVQYVIDKGVGGIMFWELAGDYAWHADRNNGNGEYYIGETLTTIAYNAFANAPAYGSVTADNISKPEKVVDLSYDFDGFKTGDNNYPINPTLRIRNNGSLVIPGGTVIEFNMPTATSDIITDQSGMGLSVVESGSNSAGNNVGGLENTFHRVRLTLPAWQSLEAGSEVDVTMNYYLPAPLPTGFRVIMNGQELGTTQEFPNLPLADGADSGGDNGNGGDDGNDTGSCSTSGIPLYPDFPQKDWAGNPSHANSGDTMIHNSAVWEALWWTKAEPGSSAAWKLVCNF